VRGARLIVLVTAALALSWTPAVAQRHGGSAFIQGPIEAGLRAGRDFENHAWSVGGQIRLPVADRVHLQPSADVFFPRHDKAGWQANGDAAIDFGPGKTVYGGGGIAFVHFAGDKTRTGYNLFFGLIPSQPDAAWKPFAEFRWTFVHDTSPFRLAVGFNRRLGG